MDKEPFLNPDHVADLLRARADFHVQVNGLQRVSSSVLRRDIRNVVAAETVGEALARAEQASQHWISSGWATHCTYHIEPAAGSDRRGVAVVFDVVEAKPKRSVGIFTSDSALPEVRGSLSNIFGGRLSTNFTYVPPASRLHSWTFSVETLAPWFGKALELAVSCKTEGKVLHPAECERVNEVRLTSRFEESAAVIGVQQRTLAARDTSCLPPSAVADFGTHSKAYVKHELHTDRTQRHRDAGLHRIYSLPISGFHVTLVNELCGLLLGGDCSFHKLEFHGSWYWSLGKYVSLQWSTRWGYVAPLVGGRVPINDRLFLSQRHVRGFKSIGPNTFDEAHTGTRRFAALGGNALIASSLSVNFPFPLYPQNGLVASHLFLDWGGLRTVSRLRELRDVSAWLSSGQSSVGAGLVLLQLPFLGAISNGRFELNVSAPVVVENWAPFSLSLTPREPRLFDRFKFGLTWSSTVSM